MIPVKCCICQKPSKNALPLSESLEKLIYLAPEKTWLDSYSICENCSDRLEEAYRFKQQCLKTHQPPEIDDIKCEGPPSDDAKTYVEFHAETGTFPIKKDHEQHRKRLQDKFECDKCGEKFALLKNIVHHCVTIHSMERKDIRPYKCPECPSTFSTCAVLIQHRKYHSKDRLFVCARCGKSFFTGSDLNHHQKLHNKEKDYKCDKCEKSFSTAQNLKTHKFVVHTDSSMWKYSCRICCKSFAMKANYEEHVKRHEGKKEFVCELCEKAFISNNELKNHFKRHSNIAEMKCGHCEVCYKDKRSLMKHLAKYHAK